VLIDRRSPVNGDAAENEAEKGRHIQPVTAAHQEMVLLDHEHAGLFQQRARGVRFKSRLGSNDPVSRTGTALSRDFSNLPCERETCLGLCLINRVISMRDAASCLAVSRQRQGRRAVAPMALPSGYERLPRKYLCGVVPSIVRNISMKALTLS
jgi:hypothetical protein